MNEQGPHCFTLTGRWLFPISAPPLARGTITVQGTRIQEVEPAGSRTPDIDLGNVAILPGLVNAHTHLDLSGMRGRCPPGPDFTDWLRAVVRHRRGLSPEQIEADIAAGLAESISHGTSLLGDISGLGWSARTLAAASLRSVVFYELLGLPEERGRQAFEAARAWLASTRSDARSRLGLSPHAPYSVGRSLLRAVADRAHQSSLPVAMHVAESLAELELLGHRRGLFVPFLRELGVWEPRELIDSIEAVTRCLAGSSPVLFVHGNYFDPAMDIPTNGTVVYCPRTHAAFGHGPHPFRELLARGIRVALGTDSLASNPDLDVLTEARFLHERYPAVPGSILLRMATLSGAEALGWADETGSLSVGKSADLVVVPLPDEDVPDPYALLLTSSSSARAVLWCGQWVQGVGRGPLGGSSPPRAS
jgi:cytosine/adenosine deaminase-related metal-dependent hydrolase